LHQVACKRHLLQSSIDQSINQSINQIFIQTMRPIRTESTGNRDMETTVKNNKHTHKGNTNPE